MEEHGYPDIELISDPFDQQLEKELANPTCEKEPEAVNIGPDTVGDPLPMTCCEYLASLNMVDLDTGA